MTDEEILDLHNDLRRTQNLLESERRAHKRTHDLLQAATKREKALLKELATLKGESK